MKLLVTGKGSSGSWQIRGQQLGRAIGANVRINASKKTMAKHDLVVMVKRISPSSQLKLSRAGRPWVWDVVDAWPQRRGQVWEKQECLKWLRRTLEILKPTAVVWPTQKMADDAATISDVPGLVLPHHARPHQHINRIRPTLKTVGYEGSPRYLQGLDIKNVCWERGLEFMPNPLSLNFAGVLVAMRGEGWDGYAARNWKSNVKLANAHATGTPIILAREQGYQENACGAEFWADDMAELARCLDQLKPQSVRQAISRQFLRAAPQTELSTIAGTYMKWLQTILDG